MFVCLANPTWRFLAAPPSNADELYGLVAKRQGLADFSGKSRDYWSMSNHGELRLCRQRIDAQDFCGSANVTFTRVEEKWRPQSGVSIPTCGHLE